MFSFEELKVIEKRFNNCDFDDIEMKNSNSIIELKKSIIDLMSELNIEEMFSELYDRKNFNIEIYDDSLPFNCTGFILENNVTKAEAKCMAKHYNKSVPEGIDISYIPFGRTEYGDTYPLW